MSVLWFNPVQDPFVAWPEPNKQSGIENLPPPPLNLSTSEYPWASQLVAAASRVLDAAGVSHCLWGDLLNRWRGNPHIPAFCGFVVSSDDLTLARIAITRAGLPPCNCKSYIHCSGDYDYGSRRIHFPIKGLPTSELFLVGDAELLYLIPLLSSHPNPAHLEFEEISLSLGQGDKQTQKVRALTRSSLIKIYLLGFALSSSVGCQESTAGYTYGKLLLLMTTSEYPYDSRDLGAATEGMRTLWDVFCHNFDPSIFRNQPIRDPIRLEWDSWLRERFPDTYRPLSTKGSSTLSPNATVTVVP
ncbi:hypothetical protein PQX77_008946 [Marasmius sp. AFHP31]|nr:hypothetical protein PQX77_008946 [Marasmius sp. AFHP31]